MSDMTSVIECRGGCVETISEMRVGAGEVRRSSNYEQVAEGGYSMIEGSRRWSGSDITPRIEHIAIIEINGSLSSDFIYEDITFEHVSGVTKTRHIPIALIVRDNGKLLMVTEKSSATMEFEANELAGINNLTLVLNPEPLVTEAEQEKIVTIIETIGDGLATQPAGTGDIVLLQGYNPEENDNDALFAFRMEGNDARVSFSETRGRAGEWTSLQSIVNAGDGRWNAVVHTFASIGHHMFITNGTMNAHFIQGLGAPTPITVPSVTAFPTHCIVHQNHLFLAFPDGRIIHSAIGDPFDFTAVGGAAELGIGGTITGFQIVPGNSLAIYGEDRVAILSGTSSADWVLTIHSDEVGAIDGTVQDMPTSIFCDQRGITTLSASDTYGNFRTKSLSHKFDPLYQRIVGNSKMFSLVNRTKSQYRIYNENGAGIHLTFTAGALVGGMEVDLKHRITAVGTTRGAEDITYFASDDGWVHRMDWGTSFSGKDMNAFLDFPYHHYKSPRQMKNFKELVFDMVGDPRTKIDATNSIERGEPYHEDGAPVDVDVRERTKAGYETSALSRFRQRFRGVAYIVGAGFDQALLIKGGRYRHIINSITVHYTYRGQKR